MGGLFALTILQVRKLRSKGLHRPKSLLESRERILVLKQAYTSLFSLVFGMYT